ncbi:hypothetical protein BB558_001798 [Smittium angustum]|uniref:Uncharacterized protein n=1 Tax=Smittium angustum TaxID=133377 RepID=A0A2U1JAM3_SMIAN|nr:hypothetical protein BB558_001798 [Smittium angustum]
MIQNDILVDSSSFVKNCVTNLTSHPTISNKFKTDQLLNQDTWMWLLLGKELLQESRNVSFSLPNSQNSENSKIFSESADLWKVIYQACNFLPDGNRLRNIIWRTSTILLEKSENHTSHSNNSSVLSKFDCDDHPKKTNLLSNIDSSPTQKTLVPPSPTQNSPFSRLKKLSQTIFPKTRCNRTKKCAKSMPFGHSSDYVILKSYISTQPKLSLPSFIQSTPKTFYDSDPEIKRRSIDRAKKCSYFLKSIKTKNSLEKPKNICTKSILSKRTNSNTEISSMDKQQKANNPDLANQLNSSFISNKTEIDCALSSNSCSNSGNTSLDYNTLYESIQTLNQDQSNINSVLGSVPKALLYMSKLNINQKRALLANLGIVSQSDNLSNKTLNDDLDFANQNIYKPNQQQSIYMNQELDTISNQNFGNPFTKTQMQSYSEGVNESLSQINMFPDDGGFTRHLRMHVKNQNEADFYAPQKLINNQITDSTIAPSFVESIFSTILNQENIYDEHTSSPNSSSNHSDYEIDDQISINNGTDSAYLPKDTEMVDLSSLFNNQISQLPTQRLSISVKDNFDIQNSLSNGIQTSISQLCNMHTNVSGQLDQLIAELSVQNAFSQSTNMLNNTQSKVGVSVSDVSVVDNKIDQNRNDPVGSPFESDLSALMKPEQLENDPILSFLKGFNYDSNLNECINPALLNSAVKTSLYSEDLIKNEFGQHEEKTPENEQFCSNSVDEEISALEQLYGIKLLSPNKNGHKRKSEDLTRHSLPNESFSPSEETAIDSNQTYDTQSFGSSEKQIKKAKNQKKKSNTRDRKCEYNSEGSANSASAITPISYRYHIPNLHMVQSQEYANFAKSLNSGQNLSIYENLLINPVTIKHTSMKPNNQ